MMVYKITNLINSKVYVGQTSKENLNLRISQHVNLANRGGGFLLHDDIRKYGFNNFKVDILVITNSKDILDRFEIFYIKKYSEIGEVYNLAPGGNLNCMDSKIVKEKHDNIMRSDVVRNKISKSMKEYRKNNPFSEEHRKNISKSLKQFYLDGNKPNYKKPFKLSESHYKAINEAKYKSVYCINCCGEIINSFESVKSAAYWWYDNGYSDVKNYRYLCDVIKRSYKNDKFIRGLKWIYRV